MTALSYSLPVVLNAFGLFAQPTTRRDGRAADAALIPRPYTNLIVYHGVLSPNAKWRPEVVRFARPSSQEDEAPSADSPPNRPPNRTWAELMRRGLDIDVLECPGCRGRLRFISAVLRTPAIRRILEHLGLPAEPVRFTAARAPPEPDELWAS